MLVALVSVIFGFQHQVQKFKCAKCTMWMYTMMYTITPTNLCSILRKKKIEIQLKYRKYILPVSQMWSKCVQLPTQLQ